MAPNVLGGSCEQWGPGVPSRERPLRRVASAFARAGDVGGPKGTLVPPARRPGGLPRACQSSIGVPRRPPGTEPYSHPASHGAPGSEPEMRDTEGTNG